MQVMFLAFWSMFRRCAVALLLIASCVQSQTKSGRLMQAQIIKKIHWKQIGAHPRPWNSFTQGLEWLSGGNYLECVGPFGTGNSEVRIVSLNSGLVQAKQRIPGMFGEGATVLQKHIYVGTLSPRVKIYQFSQLGKQLDQKGEMMLNWTEQVWGVTNDGKKLYMTNGGVYLYHVHPTTMQVLRRVPVKLGSQQVNWLNELEYHNGKVYANRLESPCVFEVDPNTGSVTGVMDLKPLRDQIEGRFGKLFQAQARRQSVLNGVMFSGGKMYATGKLWPTLFELQITGRSTLRVDQLQDIRKMCELF